MGKLKLKLDSVIGMVDDFQKKYDALQISYPKDTLSSNIDSQASQMKSNYEKLVAESKVRIDGLATEKAKWESIMSPELMNMEEILEHFPNHGLCYNPKNPSFWPHTRPFADEMKEFQARLDAGEFNQDH